MVQPAKQQAIQILRRLIQQTTDLRARDRSSPDFPKWHREVLVAIENIFDRNERHINEFKNIRFNLYMRPDGTDDQRRVAYCEGLDKAKAFLQSKIEEIEEFWRDDGLSTSPAPDSPRRADKPEEAKPASRDIFVIHGHDHGLKETVARFLERLDLNPIILHEQANKGRTIIEKLEQEGAAASYAIAIFSPDDYGYSKKSPKNKKPRARQNVVFEFGYFIGKLGRTNACALYQKGVETPSDYSGVIYIPLDDGDWKSRLVKELKAAGFEVDANLAL